MTSRISRYTLRLKPITPIHVWSGETATLGLDAFVEGRSLYVLSPDYFANLDPEVLSDVGEVTRMEAGGLFRKLFEALESRGAITPMARVEVRQLPASGQVRLLHKNIVPASTIKGYIRTAVLRRMLSQKPREERSKLFSDWIDLRRRPQDVSIGVEAKLLRKPRLERQGGALDALDSLIVSDPRVSGAKLALRELRVVNKNNPGNVIARILAVVLEPAEKHVLEYDASIALTATHLKPDTIPDGRLRELSEFRRSVATGYLEKEKLLEALRLHGCKVVDAELSKAHSSLTDYVSILQDLKSRLCSGTTSCAPARIGFMTGHEAKTFLDLVRQDAPQLYKQIAEKMSEAVGRLWDATTLKLVDYDGRLVGVGWCELCAE